jgi:hypothetical protein
MAAYIARNVGLTMTEIAAEYAHIKVKYALRGITLQ